MTLTHLVTVQSFGYLHDAPPSADIVIDLRDLLADPAHVPTRAMLDLTGRHPAVRAFVFDTAGAVDLLKDTARLVSGMARIKPVTVAFGCAGGRHRSVALAAALADALDPSGNDVTVEHLHVHLPRVVKAATA